MEKMKQESGGRVVFEPTLLFQMETSGKVSPMRCGFIIYKIFSYIISAIQAFSKSTIIRLSLSLYPHSVHQSPIPQRPNILILPLSPYNCYFSSGIWSAGAFNKGYLGSQRAMAVAVQTLPRPFKNIICIVLASRCQGKIKLSSTE